MEVIVKRYGKSEMFYELVSGKTLFVGVGTEIPLQIVPQLDNVYISYKTRWDYIVSESFLSIVEDDSFETVIFYTYDSYKKKNDDVDALDSKLSSLGMKTVFMFSYD